MMDTSMITNSTSSNKCSSRTRTNGSHLLHHLTCSPTTSTALCSVAWWTPSVSWKKQNVRCKPWWVASQEALIPTIAVVVVSSQMAIEMYVNHNFETWYRVTSVALSTSPVKTSSVKLNESSLVIELAVDLWGLIRMSGSVIPLNSSSNLSNNGLLNHNNSNNKRSNLE